MKKIGVVVLWVMLSGCLSDNRCEVEPERLVCPGGVEIEAEVPPEARCLTDGEEVVCDSGDVFEVPNEDSESDEGEGDNGYGGGDDDTTAPWPTVEETETSPWVACVSSEGSLECENGATVTDASISADSDCKWHRQPGEGPRVLCAEGILVPDGVDEDEVGCEWNNRGLVECDDGTLVDFEEASPEECVPVFSATAAGYVIECGDYRFEVENTEEEWCGYPSGEFRLSPDNIEDEAPFCRFIFGDLVIDDTGFVEIWEFDLLEQIHGGLYVVDNGRLEFIYPSVLWFVRDRVMVINNDVLEGIALLNRVAYVDGGIEVSGNNELLWLAFMELRETPNIAVGSNEEFTEFELAPGLEIEGPFLFLDHPSFPICRGVDVLVAGTEMAEGGAYVGGLASRGDSAWACN